MNDFLLFSQKTSKQTVLKTEPLVMRIVSFIPDLKKQQQKKLAHNLWLISVALTVLGGILVLFTILGLLGLGKSIIINKTTMADYMVTRNLWQLVIGLINIIMNALVTIGFAKSIKPLQNFQKKGWWYLFLICLANIPKVTISALLSFSIFSFFPTIILGLLLSLSGFYLISQIKTYFKN